MRRQSSIKPVPVNPLAALAQESKKQIEEKVAASADRLKADVVEGGLESHVANLRKENANPDNMKRAPSRKSTTDDAKALAAVLERSSADSLIKVKPNLGEAEAANDSWSRIMGTHMSPAQKAELARIRFMIDAYEKSLKSFREAEQKLLRGE